MHRTLLLPFTLALGLCPGGAFAQANWMEVPALWPSLVQQIKAGDAQYNQHCALCHQPNGMGLPQVFPPLANSDFLLANKERAIGVVLHGVSGKLSVNGQDFNASMPPLARLRDQEIANILTFLANVWANTGEAVSAEDVARVRAARAR